MRSSSDEVTHDHRQELAFLQDSFALRRAEQSLRQRSAGLWPAGSQVCNLRGGEPAVFGGRSSRLQACDPAEWNSAVLTMRPAAQDMRELGKAMRIDPPIAAAYFGA